MTRGTLLIGQARLPSAVCLFVLATVCRSSTAGELTLFSEASASCCESAVPAISMGERTSHRGMSVFSERYEFDRLGPNLRAGDRGAGREESPARRRRWVIWYGPRE